MQIKTTWTEFVSFMIVWLIPSQTPLFIILREIMGWSILMSYTTSAIFSGVIMFIIMTTMKNIR